MCCYCSHGKGELVRSLLDVSLKDIKKSCFYSEAKEKHIAHGHQVFVKWN